MTLHYLRPVPSERARAAFARLRTELDIPTDYSPAALAEVQALLDSPAAPTASAKDPAPRDFRDATATPFVTIDPPDSWDLDQAVYLQRCANGFRVHYAIAYLTPFIAAGGALDAEVHRRGLTYYAPDGSAPLHPPALSQGAASLLPGQIRLAAYWQIEIDRAGQILAAQVERAWVRSRAKLSYAQVQAAYDGGAVDLGETPADLPGLLAETGKLLAVAEQARGGVSLRVPEQEVHKSRRGYRLALRANLPVEGWNAQISLLTGRAAAILMRAAGVGVLRTLAPPLPGDLQRLRRVARALHIDWPKDISYQDLLTGLDSGEPNVAAFFTAATVLFRGAGYLVFGAERPGGGGELRAERADAAVHAAIGAEYAHVTAPLRRLVDRFGTEICLAHCAGEAIPAWTRQSLPGLPELMGAAIRKAAALDNGCVGAIEALLLADHEGEEFTAVVIDLSEGTQKRRRESQAGRSGLETLAPKGTSVENGTVMLTELPVTGKISAAALPLGQEVRVRLVEADVSARKVLFELVESGTAAL